LGRIAVIGAGGRVGRALVGLLARHGHGVDAVTRSGRVAAGERVSLVRAPDDPAGWEEVAARVDVVVSTLGPWHPEARSVVAAAGRADRPYVDPIPSVGWAREVDGGPGGAPVWTGVGVIGVLGALLARVGATELDDVVSVEIAHLVPLAGTRGGRAALVHALGESTRVVSGGSIVEEPTGYIHRPAYLPHPLGPRRAVSFPSCEPLLIHRWLPAVRSARAYTVLAGWMVGALPLAAALARRRRLPSAVLLLAGPRGHAWGVLAEVSDGVRTTRAWAVGVDAHDATAHLVARWVEYAVTGEDGGAVAVDGEETTEVADRTPPVAPADVLDDLARHGGSRWAVRPPEDVSG
jgi:hypothetical protein